MVNIAEQRQWPFPTRRQAGIWAARAPFHAKNRSSLITFVIADIIAGTMSALDAGTKPDLRA
jgi:hypothetical protein